MLRPKVSIGSDYVCINGNIEKKIFFVACVGGFIDTKHRGIIACNLFVGQFLISPISTPLNFRVNKIIVIHLYFDFYSSMDIISSKSKVGLGAIQFYLPFRL